VIFLGYFSSLGLNMQIKRLPILLPVPAVAFGLFRLILQLGAILVALAASSLAASLFSDNPSTLMEALRWISPLLLTVISLQWIWFDSAFANRSTRQFASAFKVWFACNALFSLGLIWGRLDGLLSLVSEGSGLIGLWGAALTTSYLSVLSFRRRLSFMSFEPGTLGESTLRIVKPSRFASLTILFNEMVSNRMAYILSNAALAVVWWLVWKAEALDLDNPIVIAKITGTIIAIIMLGAIVQAVTEGERSNQFQFLLLPVSASQVATFRIIRVVPFAIPPILFWFLVVVRESPEPLYGLHWAFLALLGWILMCGAALNIAADLLPRFRFRCFSNELAPGGNIMALMVCFAAWCLITVLSVSAPETIAGGLARALFWTPGAAGMVLAMGVAMALISIRTFGHSPSRLV